MLINRGIGEKSKKYIYLKNIGTFIQNNLH